MPSTGVPDRCPGVLRLHTAQDGGLARIKLPGGRIDATGLSAVAAVAEQTGGAIECSSRASLQLRGLGETDARGCARTLSDAGLLPSESHERVRNILGSPIAGRHPRSVLATDALVERLDRELCDDPVLAGLPGRFLFAIDDGSATLDTGRADLVLAPDGERLRLRVGDLETDLTAAGDRGTELLLAAARVFLALNSGTHGVRTLPGCGDELARALGGGVTGQAKPASSPVPPGIAEQRDGACAVTATVPLGRLSPESARGLAELTRAHATDARLSSDRTITLVDIEATAASEVRDQLERLGLVARPSGWQGLTACSGRGACAKALADVRAGARARGRDRRAGDPREHWAGCPRRCGLPSGDAVSVTAVAEGDLRITDAGARLSAVQAAVSDLPNAEVTR